MDTGNHDKSTPLGTLPEGGWLVLRRGKPRQFIPGLLPSQQPGKSRLKVATRVMIIKGPAVSTDAQFHAMALDPYRETELTKQVKLRKKFSSVKIQLEELEGLSGYYL